MSLVNIKWTWIFIHTVYTLSIYMILSLRLEQCKKENKLPTFTNTLLENGRQKLRITMYPRDPNKRFQIS